MKALYPIGLKSPRIEIPHSHIGFHMIFRYTKTALQWVHSNSFDLVKKFPMCRILILADIRHMGISFHAVVVFGLGKNLLFKSILGRCVVVHQWWSSQRPAKNLLGWVYINSFEKRHNQCSGISSPKLTLCRAGSTANLVFLLEICRGRGEGVLRVSSRYSIIDRPHGVEREILIGFATSSHYFQELQHLEISSAVQLCFDWLANLYRIKYMTRMFECTLDTSYIIFKLKKQF